MPSFASSAHRLLRQLLGGATRVQGPLAGTQTTLDGNTAVAVTEAGICEGAALSASFPADTADLAWRTEQQRLGTNWMGAALISRSAEGPRGALAAASGLALSGQRATTFLSGPDLACAQDLLTSAAGRHLPLVLHLSNRALAGQAATLGSGHEAVHLSADAGCFCLFAANVQEAVDFTLIARRVAEQALIPGLVIMDGEQTALAVQEVRLPPRELVERFIGNPNDQIPAPTPAQRLLFGDHRRRVPRWHDPDRPVLLGALQSAGIWGLGKVSDRLFLQPDVDRVLIESLDLFAKHTGRRHESVSTYRMEDAELVLVTQGAAVETAEAAADRVRAASKVKVGVLGVRSLRPFPGGRIASLLSRGRKVCVLERLDQPLAGDPPLLRELRAALDRARENARAGALVHPDYPALGNSDRPRLLSAIYGLGGLPLRAGDLVELCSRATAIDRSQVYLGIQLARTTSDYPKRQVLLDGLRRSYPDIADLGLTGEPRLTDLRPPEAITLAVHRISGQNGEGLALEAASLLHRVAGGQLRTRPALFVQPWGDHCLDLVTSAPNGLRDPGDQVPIDLAVLAQSTGGLARASLQDLNRDGAVLIEEPRAGAGSAPPDLIRALDASKARLYGVASFDSATNGQQKIPGGRNDYLLGAAFGVMLERGLLQTKPRRLTSVREETLAHLPEDARTARLSSFKAGLEAVRELDLETLAAAPEPSPPDADQAPAVVRKLGNIDEEYDSLPRFWDQVGVLYRQRETEEMAPDPYAAIGAIPPWSSAFRDLSALRNSIPVLDPLACTGCGACWSLCPDGAIGATALTPGALLTAGVQMAGADALRPLVSKLGPRIAVQCGQTDLQANTAGTLLTQAFDWLQAKAPLPAERKQGMLAAFERLADRIGPLPVAVTTAFFQQPEGRDKGSGELLLLAVNPDACKGCGICVSACEPRALTLAEQTASVLTDTRGVWRIWEQLPDTKRDTLDRVAALPEVGAMAATLMSRPAFLSLVGGDGAEPGSGERLVLRLSLAAHEHQRQPLVEAFILEVQSVRDKIARLIRDVLANALPADDLEALSRGLETVDGRKADLSAFLTEAENRIGGGVDAIRMRRLLNLAQGLTNLAFRLADGRQGFGRSGLGIVLSSDSVSGWAGVFPHNSFRAPVTVDLTGDGGQLAAGLLEGQLRQATEGFILLRKSRLELESAADAARLGAGLDGLRWRDLTPEEQALCPSLLLVGNASALGRRGLAQVEWLLGSKLPIRVLLLAELDLGLATRATMDTRPSAVEDQGIDLALLALGRRGACIAQSSLAAPGHLMQSLNAVFGAQGPALLQVHAPSPSRHGFAPSRTIEQARKALDGRVLPLFRYDPQGEGVLGSRLSLEGNPEPLSAWVGEASEGAATPASWALSEGRFSAWFSPLAAHAPSPLPLTEYLDLDEGARTLKTPFVECPGENGAAPQRYAVDDLLVRVCGERRHGWRALQELAGLVTPFTARVEAEARERVAADHAAELAAVRAEYEARIADLRREAMDDTRAEMRERLMALAGYADNSKGRERGADAQ